MFFRNRFIEEYLKRPWRSKRHSNFNSYRGKYKLSRRDDWTKEELIEYAKENDIKTTRQLLAKREDGFPSLYYFIKVFGSWANFLLEAYNFDCHKKKRNPHDDPHYIVKVVVSFNLYTYRKYLKARRKRPDIIPSYGFVLKHFKRWRTLKYIASRCGLKNQLKLYVDFRKKKGKWPNKTQCRKLRVDINTLIEFYGSKEGMEDLLDIYFKSIGEKDEK